LKTKRRHAVAFTTLPESIGSKHAVRTLGIQEVPRAVFGLPKQFAIPATANQPAGINAYHEPSDNAVPMKRRTAAK
jgi:hypothetical protein